MTRFQWLSALDRLPDRGHGAALAEAERSGSRLVFQVRTVALAVIAVWLFVSIAPESRMFYGSVLAAFFVLGGIGFLGTRFLADPMPISCIVIAADVALLTFVALLPGPGAAEGWTPHLNLRLGNFSYFFVYLAATALTYSPSKLTFAAVAVAVCWSIAALFVWMLPDTLSFADPPTTMQGADVLAMILHPRFFSIMTVFGQLVLFGLTAWVLTIAVRRGRSLLVERIAAESDRANLARYFPPEVTARLARDPGALDRVRRQRVVVVFMDMVGFTRLSEQLSPEAVLQLLRDYHARVAETVFAHGGSLEKFIGDAVKVTFGTPDPRPDDPVRALAAAHALIETMASWSAEREAAGLPAIHVGIGIHAGEAAVGNIGDGRSLEYTVIGDTVNVASRLERLTRTKGASIVVSKDFLDAVHAANGLGDPRFEAAGDVSLRNRAEPVPVLCWRAPSAPAPRPEAPRAHEVEDYD